MSYQLTSSSESGWHAHVFVSMFFVVIAQAAPDRRPPLRADDYGASASARYVARRTIVTWRWVSFFGRAGDRVSVTFHSTRTAACPSTTVAGSNRGTRVKVYLSHRLPWPMPVAMASSG